MTLYLKCGEIAVNVKAFANRLTCMKLDATFCPKKKDRLSLTHQCFRGREPKATKPPFLKVK